MMKKTFKRLLGLTLSAAMVISMAACGNEKQPTKESETQVVSKETETTAAKESETQVVEETEITYPLDTDETVTLWTHRYTVNGDYSDWKESPFHTGLIEKTGVNIEFRLPMTGQSTNDAYNLLFTEDVLPDVITKATNLTVLSELYEDGLIYDLAPYLEQYAPDYWAVLQADKDLYRKASTSDGKILCFWSLRGSMWGTVSTGPQIRQDWLEEQGLKSPVTLEDWEKVLTVFKEKYNATLGFQASSLKQVLFASGTDAYFTGSNGGDGMYFIDDNGELQVTYLQPEWKEYMEVLHRWYKNGLIDNDSLTMDAKAVRTKAANNQIGASYGAMSQLTNFNTDAEKNGTGAKWVGALNVRSEEGKAPFNSQGGNSRLISTATFVTTSCPEEKLITVLKLLNYGYTEEGMWYNNFGTEGVSYTKDANGNPQWTDLVANDPQGLGNAVNKYSGASAAPIGIQMDEFVRLKNAPVAGEAVDLWVQGYDISHKYSLGDLTEEESLIYTDKATALDTYINEMVQKFIMGTESLDNIDAFYKQLESMGMSECLEIQRAAYARFLAK